MYYVASQLITSNYFKTEIETTGLPETATPCVCKCNNVVKCEKYGFPLGFL